MAKVKSIVSEAAQIQLATELINLDARLQVLESETQLSRERLLKLYKELKHKSPPKGMLPFSTDWFMTWQPNIHSSLFVNIYQTLIKSTDIEDIDAIIKAYKMYLEQINQLGLPDVLSLTRAWRLVKFFDAGMLTTTGCVKCDGKFVVHTFELVNDYVCGLCNMPSRAGKTRQSPAERFFNEEAALHE
ncbi:MULTISPECIES: flagellar transcriptional regulator FlhC [Limnobacter]|uniref:Flagellar transcriptional regulator FlhC n=1 Tax=Limnobacter litoralis TaxID=481366 RepID=A0ABQ5YVA4_9BURK|nr:MULTISPECIES: flagellar transcriptional regulator FlhC [Limnobacter]GLR26704.1 flagellar transcriptional regulator FlhC [Limnobacter litoralis]HEX5486875.1 flagellar transcriptional regulator FlhC [Limnobacter sp.]